jgi:hypothetical protein
MRRWRVIYPIGRSVPMDLNVAMDYLHIFEDAICVTDGEKRFTREAPPDWWTRFSESWHEFWR